MRRRAAVAHQSSAVNQFSNFFSHFAQAHLLTHMRQKVDALIRPAHFTGSSVGRKNYAEALTWSGVGFFGDRKSVAAFLRGFIHAGLNAAERIVRAMMP